MAADDAHNFNMGVHFSAHIADGLTTAIRPPTPRTRPPVADSSESSSSPPMWGDAGPVQGAGTVSSSPHHTRTSKTGISDAYGHFSSDRVAYIPISSDSTISTASAGASFRRVCALALHACFFFFFFFFFFFGSWSGDLILLFLFFPTAVHA